MLKLSRYIVYDIIRNKIVILYTLFLLAGSFAMFRMEENSGRALLSLLNVILIVVPLVSMLFSTIHYYNSYEFIELMLSQPLSRKKILLSEFASVCLTLLMAFWIGAGIPIVIFSPDATGFSMLMSGSALTIVFTAIAFLAAVRSKDKARGIGFALLLWFYFSLIYDSLVLLVLFAFADYPMEKFTLLLSALNPIDLARISMMLQLDISALMGYTGALYKDFFGSGPGLFFVIGILSLWAIVPLSFTLRSFARKDM
ncbi:MAG: ABC transporter permease subunit [Chitinophagaceae bacterium]